MVAKFFHQLNLFTTSEAAAGFLHKYLFKLFLLYFLEKRIAAITSTLQKKLEAAFQEGLQTGELNLLSRVLRTYAIIDKTRDAELLFREVTVKPYMSEVRSEQGKTSFSNKG